MTSIHGSAQPHMAGIRIVNGPHAGQVIVDQAAAQYGAIPPNMGGVQQYGHAHGEEKSFLASACRSVGKFIKGATWDFVKNTGKALLGIDENGSWNPLKMVMNIGLLAGTAALIAISGPAAPFIVAGLAGVGLAVSAYKGINAGINMVEKYSQGDYEGAEEEAGKLGENTTGALLSATPLRSSLSAARVNLAATGQTGLTAQVSQVGREGLTAARQNLGQAWNSARGNVLNTRLNEVNSEISRLNRNFNLAQNADNAGSTADTQKALTEAREALDAANQVRRTYRTAIRSNTAHSSSPSRVTRVSADEAFNQTGYANRGRRLVEMGNHIYRTHGGNLNGAISPLVIADKVVMGPDDSTGNPFAHGGDYGSYYPQGQIIY